MNRKEYIKELSECLKDVSEDEKKDAVKYCEEYFDEAGIEKEEDAIKELGSPNQFARNVKGSIAVRKDMDGKKKTAKNDIKTIWIILLAIIASPLGFPLAIVLLSVLFALGVAVLSVFFAVALIVTIVPISFIIYSITGISLSTVPFGGGFLWQSSNPFIIIGFIMLSLSILIVGVLFFSITIKYIISYIKKIFIYIFNKIKKR